MTTAAPAIRARHVALIGNPNSGKTTLFNALTGLRQKVGNYPGVTVEKKEGLVQLADGSEIVLLDLPGTYSLNANSPDEKVVTDILLGQTAYTSLPDLVVCVVDASNLERNLYLVSQIIDRRLPVVIALSMTDVASSLGISININLLEVQLGTRVIPIIANHNIGLDELKRAIRDTSQPSEKGNLWQLPEPVQRECDELVGLLQHHHGIGSDAAFHEAVSLLTTPHPLGTHSNRFAPELLDHVAKDHEKLDFLGFDRQSVFVESRYAWIKEVCDNAVKQSFSDTINMSDRLDRIFTHKIWGFLIFLGIMALMFHMIFTWATYPMELIGAGFDWLGYQISAILPPGEFQSLVVDGGLSGVAAVVTFLPQILFLFLFLGLLEDTGYMARAAFIMDRVMSKIGLHGRSFIPMLSSFACAIPGIMATRTIENPKDRLVTMLVAPLVSCSARLPVYTLLIAAFIPTTTILGFISLPALTMFLLYLLGIVAAFGMAWLFKKTLLRSAPAVFIMELPPYRLPSLKSVLLQMWDRAKLFLRRAGTIILGVSIVLWFLASYPKLNGASPAKQLEQSFVGRIGHVIEPAIAPLGFDWKIGIGIIASLLQREVFVSTMGTIYNIQDAEGDDGSISLREKMIQDVNPNTGQPTFTVLTAICLMVYYVLALQCMSTVAVMRRETNGWKWPLFQLGYMTALSYGATFLVFKVGQWIGLGG
ncbi:MAG: ferrous iron transport protein B [Bacteroidota bacterium]